MDFGAGFEREAAFFSEFPTTVVKTNLRELQLDRNSWTFMGVGAILLMNHLKLSHIGFGSILEASPSNLKSGLARPNAAKTLPIKRPSKRTGAPALASNVFAAAGMEYLNPVSGMTEVGTAKIVAEQFPELAESSLNSLASEGSEKLDRKRILLSFFVKKGGVPEHLIRRPTAQFVFGEYLTSDFLAIWIQKNFGRTVAERIVANVPAEVEELVKANGLRFYERFCPGPYSGLANSNRSRIVRKLNICGIPSYTELDFIEYGSVLSFLAKFHPELARMIG